MARRTLGIVAVGSLLAVLAGAAPPATQEGGPETRWAADAFDLGSADFAVRQSASMRLWWAGESAEPALHATATSGNPEAGVADAGLSPQGGRRQRPRLQGGRGIANKE